MNDNNNNGEQQEAAEEDFFYACTDRTTFELLRVSDHQRERAMDDVWSRNPPIIDLDDGLQLLLDDETSVLQIMQKNVTQHRVKPAFNKAVFLNPIYAYNCKLLKLFYQCNPTNPKDAACHYCQHFQYKLQYFGIEHLPKPVLFKDLKPKDKAILYSGCLQLGRDKSDRIVLYLLPGLLPGFVLQQKDNDPLICALWWLLFRAIQEEEKIGVVIVIIGNDKDDVFGKTITSSSSILSQALPIQILSIHAINDNPKLEQEQIQQQQIQQQQQQGIFFGTSGTMISRLELKLSRHSILRLRYHECDDWNITTTTTTTFATNSGNGDGDSGDGNDNNNSPLEKIQKKLECFGITYIPLNFDGSLVMNNPIDPSSKRYFFKQVEPTRGTTTSTTTSSNNEYIVPNPKDVLLGRGKPFQEYPGNIALADQLDKYRESYNGKNSRREKTNISLNILNTITTNGGRFLKKDGDHWSVVPDVIAREKIAHGFRMPRQNKRPLDDNNNNGNNDNGDDNNARRQRQVQQDTVAAGPPDVDEQQPPPPVGAGGGERYPQQVEI